MQIKDKCKDLLLWLVAMAIWFVEVRGECDTLPEVRHSRNNAASTGPFPENHLIEFRCMPFYKGFGNDTYTCKNGSWVGKYHCFRTCYELEPPVNGYVVGKPSYMAGSRIKFDCNKNCKIDGPSSLTCRADGKWRPHHPPTCKLIECGEFGSVTNGRVHHTHINRHRNGIGTKLKVRCRGSYRLEGNSRVTCNANGQWSSRPTCRSYSSCGRHPGAQTKCTRHAEHSGSVVKLSCHPTTENKSVTIVGPLTDFCMGTKWHQGDTGCFCNCKSPDEAAGVRIYGLDPSNFVKHGDELKWECDEGYRKKHNSKCVCIDGEMPSPVCEKIDEEIVHVKLESRTKQYEATDANGSMTTQNYEGIDNYIIISMVVIVIIMLVLSTIYLAVIKSVLWMIRVTEKEGLGH